MSTLLSLSICSSQGLPSISSRLGNNHLPTVIALQSRDAEQYCQKMKVLITPLCPTLCEPMDCTALQASLCMEFSRQEYWSGLPLPSPGDLPNPGIEPRSPALPADSLPSELE